MVELAAKAIQLKELLGIIARVFVVDDTPSVEANVVAAVVLPIKKGSPIFESLTLPRDLLFQAFKLKPSHIDFLCFIKHHDTKSRSRGEIFYIRIHCTGSQLA